MKIDFNMTHDIIIHSKISIKEPNGVFTVNCGYRKCCHAQQFNFIKEFISISKEQYSL